jgi:translation initiation factor IF-3
MQQPADFGGFRISKKKKKKKKKKNRSVKTFKEIIHIHSPSFFIEFYVI